MRKDGLVVTLQEAGCWVCNKSYRERKVPGYVEGRITCKTCKGTRRAGRGGRNGCKSCLDGTQNSGVFDVVCNTCDGSGRGMECRTDTMPDEWFSDAPFVVYRDGKRMQTFAEAYIGVGFFSCTDYGNAYSNSDEWVINDVRKAKNHQLCKAVKENKATDDYKYTFCNHIGISVHQNGYSVVPIFMDGTIDDAIDNDVSQKIYGRFTV